MEPSLFTIRDTIYSTLLEGEGLRQHLFEFLSHLEKRISDNWENLEILDTLREFYLSSLKSTADVELLFSDMEKTLKCAAEDLFNSLRLVQLIHSKCSQMVAFEESQKSF